MRLDGITGEMLVIVEAIQNLTLILAKSSPYATINAERQAFDQLRLVPGQQVQAEVLACLPNQRFLARIAGELFRIELPIILQPGETLQLTFVTGEPHPVFSLSRSGNSATPVTISDTGKLLGELSSSPADRQQLAPLARGGPLLSGAPPDATLFAALLRDAMSLNGVFYEAHLLQWFLGGRALQELLKEPQGKLPGRTRGVKGKKRKRSRVESDNNAAEEQAEELAGGLLISDDGERSSPWVDPRAIPIIKEQLCALNSGQVVWQGEVWPRQEMEWRISEEKQFAGEETERNWVTTLHLVLPLLGEVAATLQLEREGLSVSIKTEREEASKVMREEKETLVQAMAGAGVKLLNLTIEHGDERKGA